MKDATLKRMKPHGYTSERAIRPISVADAVKFTKQAFYGGNPEKYTLLSGSEKTFILPYLRGQRKADHGQGLRPRQTTRITCRWPMWGPRA